MFSNPLFRRNAMERDRAGPPGGGGGRRGGKQVQRQRSPPASELVRQHGAVRRQSTPTTELLQRLAPMVEVARGTRCDVEEGEKIN
jgi:hypothetical protein